MSSRLEALARRMQADPAFLAAPLADFAHSADLDDAALAQALDCSIETLTLLRLCRRPRPDPLFAQDIQRIAERFVVDIRALAEAVRRADALAALRPQVTTEYGTLIAARDREASETDPAP